MKRSEGPAKTLAHTALDLLLLYDKPFGFNEVLDCQDGKDQFF
jgi:hypothetical protein